MKTSLSARSGLALAGLLAAATLAACGGGGGTTAVPTTPTQQTTSSGSVSIGSLDVMHPASTTAVNVTSRTPAGPTVDVQDRAPVALGQGTDVGASVVDSSSHAFVGHLTRTTSAAQRSSKTVAVNSPFDLSYHGGPVLGSAVSHNIFVNCNSACRSSLNFNPGPLISALNNDPYITLLYQYLTSPGVIDTTPVNGNYPKGLSADKTVTYASPQPSSTNPYYGQRAIWFLVLNAAGGLGQPDTGLGGGGLGHIYHVFLPQNVDTCFESGGVSTGSCYSPDNGSTFAFCAYHGSITFRNGGGQRQTYLYTVEPYQDVNGCRNAVYNQGTLPNAASPTVNPADPGYSTLSHELFETITDPVVPNAWFNNFSGGNEIADICAEYDNFVTLSGHQYVLQSEYSDVNHECVSANLTNSGVAQTPQTVRSSH